MKNSESVCRAFLAAVFIGMLLFSPAVFAYLDPSTGSMVVSAIVGIIASIALAVKTYWYKIKSFFRRNSKQETASEEPSD